LVEKTDCQQFKSVNSSLIGQWLTICCKLSNVPNPTLSLNDLANKSLWTTSTLYGL